MPRRLKLLCCGPLFGGCWLDQRALCFFPHLVLERVDVAQHVRVVKLLQQLHLRVRGLRAQQGNQRERRVRREAQKKVSLRRGPPFLFRPARGGGNAPPPPPSGPSSSALRTQCLQPCLWRGACEQQPRAGACHLPLRLAVTSCARHAPCAPSRPRCRAVSS